MKRFKLLLISLCMVFAAAFCFAACGEGETNVTKPEYGTVSGVVKDADGEVLEGAEVFYTDAESTEEEENSVETDEEGKYEIKRVKLGEVTLKVSLGGYADNTKTLTEADFTAEGAATANFVMEEGMGIVQGTVSMDGNTTQKLANVTVSIGKLTATTDANGKYEIKDVPMLSNKTVTARLAGYEDGTGRVTSRSFSNGVARVDFALVQNDVSEMPGIKPYQLETLQPLNSAKLTYSASEISSLMNSSADNIGGGTGKVETHGEGYCINSNTGELRDNMSAYIFAKMEVTEQNQFLTAYARIFYGQNGGDGRNADGTWIPGGTLAKLGLYAFEIKEDGKSYTFINDNRFGEFVEIKTEAFMAVSFDLSSMKGKTIVFVLGTRTGYHCCLNRIEFGAVEPEYLEVTGVDGLTQLRKYNKVTDTDFDGAALKDKWAIGGGTSTVDEGIQLNGTDPWKAVDYDAASPQPVNSYMYITTDITAAKAHLTLTATILKLADTLDPGQDNKQFLPYFCVIVLNAQGAKVYQSAWTKLTVDEDKQEKTFDFDLSAYAGTDMTVVIAANVGYRATITGVHFNASAPEGAAAVQPAILPAKREN